MTIEPFGSETGVCELCDGLISSDDESYLLDGNSLICAECKRELMDENGTDCDYPDPEVPEFQEILNRHQERLCLYPLNA